MLRRVSYLVYRGACGLVWLFYRKPAFEGLENLPEGACVIVGNHAQMNGPIIAELYIPGDRAIWCAEEMMHLKEVPAYAYSDFWSGKPACTRWFFRLASYAIAPLSVCVFNNAHCIGVYRDMRVMSTFRESVAALRRGTKIVIFPETDPPVNDILYTFQDRFIDLGRMYAHAVGQTLKFVPMYVAPALDKVFFGPPIAYDDTADPNEERARIAAALTRSITEMAVRQPRHRVVPYRNVSKKNYPMNKS